MSSKSSTPTDHVTPTPPANELPRRRPSWTISAIGLALGLGLLALVVRSVDLEALRRSFRGIEPWALVPVFVIAMMHLPLRPWRWVTAFPRDESGARTVGFRICFEALAVGNLVNCLVPARGGDLLRCWLIRRRSPDTKMALAFGTLALEKMLDGIALVAVLGVAGLVLPLPPWLGRLTAVAAAGFAVMALATTVLHHRAVRVARYLDEYQGGGLVARVARRAGGVTRPFARGVAAINSPHRIVLMAFQTALIVVAEAATIWFLAHSLGVELPPSAAFVVVAVLGLGFMLPAAPGFVGTYEALGIVTLALFGVTPTQAAAITLLAHGWTLAWTAVVGVVGLVMGGLSVGQVLRSVSS